MGGWQEMTDEALITYAEEHHSGDFAAAPAMEMQRRLLVAIREFNRQSGEQAATMIRLTWAIVALTIVLGIVAGLQLWAMLEGVAWMGVDNVENSLAPGSAAGDYLAALEIGVHALPIPLDETTCPHCGGSGRF